MSTGGGSGDLLQVLQLACSQDPDQLKVGERQLDEWKKQTGFYSGLAGVFSNRSVEAGVRWMALTCAKNGVDQFWRPGAPNGVSDEEKAMVRSALLQCIEEPVPQVSTQLAVVIARIAHYDCPDKWPELLPILTEGVRSSLEATRKCYLRTMKAVTKTLAGRRLMNQRKVFYDVTANLFVYVVELWNTHLQEGVAQLSRGEGEVAIDMLELARLCLKILRLMVVYGFPKFNGILQALQFMSTVLERIPGLVQMRGQLPADHAARITLEKNINLKMKIIKEIHSSQPIGFAPFVSPSLELIHGLLFSSTDTSGQLYEKLTIACLNLFRLILRCEDYTPPQFKLTESVPPPGVMEAHQAKLTFFKASTCQHLVERLVGHYLLLTDEELQVWEDSPEEFVKEQPGDMYDCSLRRCVESALVALAHEFQLTVVPSLLMLVQKVQAIGPDGDLNTLKVKEAVYTAVGLCAFQLYDELDYDTWYQTHLVKELSLHDPRYKIVRCRVVWLLGQWVTVKMSPSLRPSLYSVVVPLLAQHEDMAVRLTAADVIRICVDDLDFSVSEFVPFLSDCTSFLFQLLREAQEVETKMKVLNSISLLMERVGPGIQPHVGTLLQALPSLWEESGGQNSSMLRSIIVSTLSNITKGLEGASVGLHEFTLPVIKFATDTKLSEHVYLAEDGLTLWLTTLQHSPAPSPALIQLVGNMIGLLGLHPPSDDSTSSMAGLMDIGSENLLMCFQILDAYAVLCSLKPEYFLESCSDIVVRGCQYYLCDVKPRGVVLIVNLLSRVVEVYSNHSPHLVESLLPTILQKLLEEEDYPPTTTAYLTLIARVLVHQPTFFFTFLEKMCSQSQQTAAELFGIIIDTWSERLDSVSNIQCRKLTGLAIANLLPVGDICVTSRFNSLINMCVDILHDVMDTNEDNQLYDILVTGRDKIDDTQASAFRDGEQDEIREMSTIDTEHDRREKKLSSFDPMRTIALHQHFASKLEQCLSVHEQAAYSALMNKVDMAVREQLLEFIPLNAAHQLLNIFLQEDLVAGIQ